MYPVMSLGMDDLYMQFLVPIIIPFLAGLAFGFTYKKIRKSIAKIIPRIHENASIVNAIASEYARRMEKYDSAIADLRVRLDVIELQSQKHLMTQQVHSTENKSFVTLSDTSQEQSHRPSFSAYHRPKIEHLKRIAGDIPDSNDVHNGTADYVLKLLDEKSMTSKEVQHAIGRSREHTSRLMKRLCEYGFVNRDSDTKPFTYALAEAGRLRLKERYHVTHTSLDTSQISQSSRVGSSIKD
jgi:CRP-like cAMP-binding protein